MQVKSIAECSKESILQYFKPSLSYNLSFRSLFCLFLSGCLSQSYRGVRSKSLSVDPGVKKSAIDQLAIILQGLFNIDIYKKH